MYVFIKRFDEGTDPIFIARLFAWMLELRDLLVMGNTNPQNRQISSQEFDKLYDPLLRAMKSVYDAANLIINMIEEHKNGISSGSLVEFHDGSFTISETIDEKINQEFGKLLDNGVIAVKDRIQLILRQIYDLDIGCVYQKQDNFNAVIVELRKNNKNELANYLEILDSSIKCNR